MKKTLWEVYDICKKYCKNHVSEILLYILKLDKMENIYEFNTLKEYLNYIKPKKSAEIKKDDEKEDDEGTSEEVIDKKPSESKPKTIKVEDIKVKSESEPEEKTDKKKSKGKKTINIKDDELEESSEEEIDRRFVIKKIEERKPKRQKPHLIKPIKTKYGEIIELFEENPSCSESKSLEEDNVLKSDKKHILGIDFKQIDQHKFIEDLLIDFLFLNKAKKDDFYPFFEKDYIETINLIAQMYRGEEISAKKYNYYLAYSKYEEYVKKTEMTICEHNPKEFKINEDIKIDIDFKNIKSINISTYEINTENYYLETKAPLNSLFNIEGIIASNNMDMVIEGGEDQLKKIRKTIELTQIEKGKPGIYLVEILGKGISSRIIIKRGRLSLITRNTSKGILCQIINENNEIMKDDKTYLWYNDIKFSCEPKEGIIILPYKVLVDKSNKCILVHDSYADLAEIEKVKGNYQLKGYFNILKESIIPNNMLKVNFKPFLFVNGRETSLELIKKGTITVEMEKSENNNQLPVSTVFENITFKDDSKDYEFEVLVPPMMTKMKFIFDCEINNVATGEKKTMSYEQDSNFDSSNEKISKPLLHKIGKNYILEEIGRNGENITSKAGTNVEVEILTNYYLKYVKVSLQYDEEGKLNLGELKDVVTVKIGDSTYHLNDYSKYCYPKRIDIVLGESFTLPIYSNKAISLDDFILYQYYTTKDVHSVLMDNKKEIILKPLDINGDKEHYYEFTIGKTLPKGKYYLSFGNSERTYIIIKVRDGKHWMNIENYIIDEKGFVENSKNKTPIYMKNLSIDKEKGEIAFECAKTRRNIKYTHANIYLSQYQKPKINSYFYKYWSMLNQGVVNLVSNKFSNWNNIYLSNRVLNEEIEYVLQRRNLENQLGNSLPMPSLLLKRSYKRDCINEEEDLEAGDNYKKEDADMGRKKRPLKKGKFKEDKEVVNTDFYNFLKYPGYALNNIEPINIDSNDDFAKFKIKFSEKEKDILSKYSYIQIVLIDNKSISSDFHCLCSDNDKYKIEKRNISNEKALDSNKNITEIKTTELIKKGKEFNIDETSNYKLVDSIQKLCKFYLLTLENKDKYWNDFNFILNLNEDNFNEEEFLEKYNQVCGHEINLFLYFKYPKLFEKYVKNILKFKFEKTFIDYFLLDDYETLLEYLTPLKIKLLPINELCLLMIKIIEKNPNEAKKIKDIIKSRIEKPEEVENLLLTNFNIMMNMTIEVDEDLEKEDITSLYDKKTAKKKCKRRYIKNESENCVDIESDECDMDQADFINESDECDMDQADFINEEKKFEVNYALEKAKKEMGNEYEKPGVTKEYKERHYFIKEHKSSTIKNPIWLDFAEHILSNHSYDNFLSKYVLYNKIYFNEFLFILSVIGIPAESTKHGYKRIQNSRLITITPQSNLILFTKELRETQLNINDKLLINQNVKDTVHNDMNVNINNCTTGITYTHQTIITNISNKKLMFQLFVQIPQGAICLNSTYYTNSIKMDLKPYETQNYETYFYFPNVGKFPQYHPLACENINIISVGNSLLYEVKKEYIPSKSCEVIEDNKYAKDMRVEGKLRNILSDDNIESQDKLNNILNYFNDDIFDEIDINNVLYLLKKNKQFYTDFISALRNCGYYRDEVWSFAFYHKDEEGIKEYLCNNNEFINDLGYDYKSSLYSYTDIDDAAARPHLEYAPLYNARKHPFGTRGKRNESSIANTQFKETYGKFIIDLLSLRELTIKEKLQLIYYLILQDRMDEALNILQKIKMEEVDDNKNKSYRIQYDYINAYLDFCFGYPEFKIAKSLCSKYKDFPWSTGTKNSTKLNLNYLNMRKKIKFQWIISSLIQLIKRH